MLLIFLLRRTQMLFLINDDKIDLLFNKVPNNEYTYLCIKTWKVLKGTIVCCEWFCRRKCYNIYAIFHTRGVFFPTSYFSSERVRSRVKIVSYIPSLFYQKPVKIVSSDKRESHTGYTILLCLVIAIHYLL